MRRTTLTDLVLTSRLLSVRLPEALNGHGPSASGEHLSPVQYKRAAIQGLFYGIKRAGHKRGAAQNRCKEDSDKNVPIRIEVKSGDQV